MLGGAQYWKHKVFSCERRRREAMLGGYGGMLPRIFLINGAIRCILVHSRAHFSLQNFAVFFLRGFLFCFLNVTFADKSENKEKEPYMWFNGFKSGTDFRWDRTYTVLASTKKSSSLTWLRASGSRPDTLPAHVYCNVTKFNLLYLYNYSAVVMNLAHFHTPKIIPI